MVFCVLFQSYLFSLVYFFYLMSIKDKDKLRLKKIYMYIKNALIITYEYVHGFMTFHHL
jgi:Mg2+ and Co2+ transporter CorA